VLVLPRGANVDEANVNLFEGPTQQASELAQRVRGGARLTLASGVGKTTLIHEIASHLGKEAIVLNVPKDLDKTAYVLLAAAAQCGADTLRETGARLAAHQTAPTEALEVLRAAIGKRPILVDNLDALGGSATDVDLRGVFRTSLNGVHTWLETHAAVASM